MIVFIVFILFALAVVAGLIAGMMWCAEHKPEWLEGDVSMWP